MYGPEYRDTVYDTIPKRARKIIERDFIPVGKINKDDVKYEEILELRSDTMGFFRDQVNTIMVRKVNMLGIRNGNVEKVRNMRDLNKFVSEKKSICAFHENFVSHFLWNIRPE